MRGGWGSGGVDFCLRLGRQMHFTKHTLGGLLRLGWGWGWAGWQAGLCVPRLLQ